jgi:hypothetical protein
MLRVSSVLDHLEIRRTSVVIATQDVGIMVRESIDPNRMASKLFNDILDHSIEFDDGVYAGIVCKKMIAQVILLNCEIDNKDLIVAEAIKYGDSFRNNPKNAYLWTTISEKLPKIIKIEKVIEKKIVNTIPKSTRAMELYKEILYNNKDNFPSRKEIINIFVDKLKTTPMGASTYIYTITKELGHPKGWIGGLRGEGVMSKVERVEQLYRICIEKGLSREEFLQLIVEKTNSTLAGANTYLFNCIKKLGKPNHWISSKRVSYIRKKGDGFLSKQEQTNNLYLIHMKNNPIPIQEFLKLLMEQVDTSVKGAHTLYYNAKKMVGQLENRDG